MLYIRKSSFFVTTHPAGPEAVPARGTSRNLEARTTVHSARCHQQIMSLEEARGALWIPVALSPELEGRELPEGPVTNELIEFLLALLECCLDLVVVLEVPK